MTNGWIGKTIKDDSGKVGKIVGDQNGRYRILSIRFDDGEEYSLILNNCGPDSKDDRGIMYEFYNKWAYISDSRRTK